jgi:hypothetical protein
MRARVNRKQKEERTMPNDESRQPIAGRRLTVALLLLLAAPAGAQDKLPEEAQKAEAAVKADLDKIKGGHAQLIVKAEPALTKVFPNSVFVVARYRQFPVARVLPKGLRASNVFAVTKDSDKARIILDTKELKDFFQAFAAPVKTDTDARNALAAWLLLAQEMKQDGFYKFEVLQKEFSVESNEKRTDIRGRAIIIQGGKGEINVTLVFEDSKLTKATETSKIMPGPRPICQATKLLDADPIVRKMAEQDLLFMGLAAREYLMEQRAQAHPELREAIDRLWRQILASGW